MNKRVDHSKTCSAVGASNVKRRVTQNRFIHKTKVFIKRLNKFVPHILKYKTSNLFKTIVPTTMVSMDFESTTAPFQRDSPQDRAPKNAIFEQKVLGGSYHIRSLYPAYDLSPSMQEPRVMFFDNTRTTEQQFYLQFFKMLRSDISNLYFHERQILNHPIFQPT